MTRKNIKKPEPTEEDDLVGNGPGIGHNSGEDDEDETDLVRAAGGIAGQRLRAFIERIERLEEEKAAFAEDIREVYAEAKGVGFDAKTIRKLVKLRKMEAEKRREEEELLDIYRAAIGLD